MKYLFFSIIGYLSGCVMYGFWIPKLFKGVDVCALSDDGNPGTANAFKYGGFFAGSCTVVADVLKGFFPVWLALRYVDVADPFLIPIVLAPVLGHAFPLFGRTKGGKSIAVSFGVLVAFFPDIMYVFLLAAFFIFFSLIFVIEPHIYRSIFTYVCFCISEFVLCSNWVMHVCCILISLIVIFKHLIKYHGERLSVHFLFLGKTGAGKKKEADIR